MLDLWTSVTRSNMATGALTSVAGPGAGIRAIEAGGGYLWLCHAENNTVSRIDMATQRLDPMPPVTVGRQPSSMAFANDILDVGNIDDRSILADGPERHAPRAASVLLTDDRRQSSTTARSSWSSGT